MSIPLKVLVVEDSESDALVLVNELRFGGYDPTYVRAENAQELIELLDNDSWDIVIADYVVPGISGPEALVLVKTRDRNLPFIIVTGKVSKETAAKLVTAGADDYVMKDHLERLVSAVRRALEKADIRTRAPTPGPAALKVLLVEDSEDDALLVVNELETRGYQVEFHRVDTASAVELALQGRTWDVIISDYAIPRFGGVEALALVKKSGLDIPFILISGKIGEEQAVEVMKAGASDFVPKDKLTRLVPVVEREIRAAEVRKQRRLAEDALRDLIAHLDKRVEERTSALLNVTEDLRGEVASHKKTLEDLRSHQLQLQVQNGELRRSQERYRAVVDTQTEMVCRYLPDGTFTFANEAYLKYFGKKAEDVIGHKFVPMMPEQDREAVARHFASFGPDRTTVSHEHRFITASGDVRWLQWTDTAILGDSEHVVEFQGVGRDVTELKSAAKVLQEANQELERRVTARTKDLRVSEERYRSLFNDSRDGIYATTRDGAIVEANKSLSDIFGYTREEMMAMNAVNLYVNPDDRLRFQEHIEQSGYVENFEVTLRRKDGTRLDCLLTASLRRGGDGTVLGYQGTIRDITEKKKAEETLRESEQRFRNVFEQGPIGIAIVGLDYRWVAVNSTLCEMVGYSEDELTKLTFVDITHPDDIETSVGWVEKLSRGEIPC